eukprot:TRINITY_DN5425_c0_g1_i1.p1 TRINITY_DN5425_c0_g1~~TRINITY_DN5425_c0_g1_i1.p1  ORF type:complete len:544 (-),score=52.07 TRINITY_DN5425_c0_g1_i1:9-1640(-)
MSPYAGGPAANWCMGPPVGVIPFQCLLSNQMLHFFALLCVPLLLFVDSASVKLGRIDPQLIPNTTTSLLHFANGAPVPLPYLPTQIVTKISVGSLTGEYTVLFDTGSSALVLADVACSTCDNPTKYDAASSSTHKTHPCTPKCTCLDGNCQSEAKYGDGSGANGILVEDDFHFAGYTAKSVVFASMRSQIVVPGVPGVFSPEVDGIWGVAFQSLNCQPIASTYCLPTVMDQLMQDQTLASTNLFAIWVGENAANPGVLTLGEVDTSQFHARTMQYVPLRSEMYYDVGMSSLAVDTEFVIANQPQVFGTRVIVDTGTTLLLLSKDSWLQLGTFMQRFYCSLPGMCGDNNVWQYSNSLRFFSLTREEISKFPTLFIYFGKQGFPVTADFYWRKVDGVPNQYFFGISTTSESMTILGDIFMRPYYTVFDRKLKRLGFGLAVQYGPESLPQAPPAPADGTKDEGPAVPLWIIASVAAGGGTCLLLTFWVTCMYRRGKVPAQAPRRHKRHPQNGAGISHQHPGVHALSYPPQAYQQSMPVYNTFPTDV